jgi:hypothetical protein
MGRGLKGEIFQGLRSKFNTDYNEETFREWFLLITRYGNTITLVK